MPVYDSFSLITEKQAFVLDLGTKYTKFGFAGEACPRCIVTTEVKCQKTGLLKSVFVYQNEDEFCSLLVDFLHILFFKHVQLSPKERRMVIVESLLSPTSVRDTLAKVLFQHFEVCSLLYVPSPLVTLATLAVDTGLVVDVGYQEALVVPVFHGVPVLRIWQAQPLAGAAVEHRLRETLIKWYTDQEGNLAESVRKTQKAANLPDSVIEDIKVRGSFVTKMERGILFGEGENPSPPVPDITYPIDGHSTIVVPGPVRESCHEVLFERDNDQLSLPNIILDAIEKSVIDMRKPLAENIILVGGSVMVPGFKARLVSELKTLLDTKYKDKLNITTFKFHNPPGKENYLPWLGGALYGGTEMVNLRSLTRENYLAHNSVPDWCNLLSNTNERSVRFI